VAAISSLSLWLEEVVYRTMLIITPYKTQKSKIVAALGDRLSDAVLTLAEFASKSFGSYMVE
jgi:hypothetical protein